MTSLKTTGNKEGGKIDRYQRDVSKRLADLIARAPSSKLWLWGRDRDLHRKNLGVAIGRTGSKGRPSGPVGRTVQNKGPSLLLVSPPSPPTCSSL